MCSGLCAQTRRRKQANTHTQYTHAAPPPTPPFTFSPGQVARMTVSSVEDDLFWHVKVENVSTIGIFYRRVRIGWLL